MASPHEVAERLYGILQRCLDATEPVLRQEAEAELQRAELQPDFFASLAMIMSAGNDVTDGRVRWLAAVYSKNAVKRRWRPTKHSQHPNPPTEEERGFVRETFLDAVGAKVDEPLIAIQVSEWISRVARSDYPEYWPSLLEDLVQRYLTAQDPRVVCQALTTMDMVFKQLATRRLRADRMAFEAVARNYFGLLLQILNAQLPHVGPDTTGITLAIVVRCVKALRRLITAGMQSIEGNADVRNLFAQISSRPELFLVGLVGGSETQQRLSLLAGKLVNRTHARHPIEFFEYLSHFMESYFKQLLAFNSSTSPERVAFQAARFLRNVAQCPDYKISKVIIERFRGGSIDTSQPHEVVAAFVLSFYGPERTQALVSHFLSHVFVLSPSEIDTWMTDPETLIQDEESAEWRDDSVRHECEELLKTLLVRDKERISGLLLGFTESVEPEAQPLILDACYRAIGKCVYDLEGIVPFEKWMQQQLGPILAAPPSENMGVRVLKARAAWLTGQFVGQLSRQARAAVYSLLVPLLSFEKNDHVVALTASGALKHLVEDLGFYGTDFAPNFAVCLSNVLKMSEQSENVQTKRDLLAFSSSLIERCPLGVVLPFVDDIASVLPRMWDAASSMSQQVGEQPRDQVDDWGDRVNDQGIGNMYRTSLALLVTGLVRKVGAAATQSATLFRLSLNIIVFGTDLGNASSGAVYMIEEACELWEVVLSAMEAYSPEIASLIPRAFAVLDADFDHIKIMYRILEGYALLGGTEFLRKHGEDVGGILESAFLSLRDRGCLATCEVLDLLLQLFPAEGPVVFANALRHAIMAASSGRESRGLAAAYVGLVLRGFVANPDKVEECVMKGDPQALVRTLELGVETLDNMYLLQRRKLAILGMCSIVSRHCGRVSGVQERVPLVLDAIVQVFAEEYPGVETPRTQRVKAADFDNYVARFGESECATDEERISARMGAQMPGSVFRDRLASADPARTANVKTVAAELFASLRSMGEEVYNHIMRSTDGNVLSQLESFLGLPRQEHPIVSA